MRFRHALRLMRPKQWVKNFFVFAPLMFARGFTDPLKWQVSLVAFAYFCLASAFVYVLNDLRDIESDRRHPYKSQSRPLASGEVNVETAKWMLGLFALLLASGFLVIPKVILVILGYVALNVGYSFFARRVPVLDIFTIALGFVLRVFAGALAIEVPVSGWMFVTTLCLALYLAALKRRHEFRVHGSEFRKSLGGYTAVVVERFAEISATAALVCYSIFALTVQTELVYTIPLVAFGLFRYWLITERLTSSESPTEAMLRDFQLVGAVVLWVLTCAWALIAGH